MEDAAFLELNRGAVRDVPDVKQASDAIVLCHAQRRTRVVTDTESCVVRDGYERGGGQGAVLNLKELAFENDISVRLRLKI